MIKKKWLASCLAVLCLFSACGSQQTAQSAETASTSGVGASDEKTRLVVAAIGSTDSLSAIAESFNDTNDTYYVEIVDYTDSGTYTEDEAFTRLNTEMLSGTLPDMLCFSSLSPYPYINKGYLADLSPYFETDGEISLDDIAIAHALGSEGGIYYISGVFFMETLEGLYSTFGDRHGWTLSEYLDIESARPAESETLYNTTRDQFLRQICARYIRTAIDWESGSCDFDNDAFAEILEASSRIRENPEDTDNLNFTYGSVRVAEGSLVAACSYLDTVWKLAYDEALAGCRLSFIGWPTPDGSCGSDIYLQEPLGIVSQSPNADGCWEFIKFILKDAGDIGNEGLRYAYGLPVYLPALEARVENVKTSQDNPVQMTEEDAERFYALIAATENVAMYDETVLEMIAEEAAAFFAGDQTAEDAAANIQARVSIYVAEQG